MVLDCYPNDESVYVEDGDEQQGQEDRETERESGISGTDDPYSKPWSKPDYVPVAPSVPVNGVTVTGDVSGSLSTFRPWGTKNLEASSTSR